MSGPVRVLYVNGGSLDYGGISTVLLNYVGRFDRRTVAVDFLVHGEAPGPREEEALALGARVIHAPYRRADYFGNRRALLRAFSDGYDIVHAHMDGMNGYALALAGRAGVRVRVSHSHNTAFLTNNPVKAAFHRLTANRIPQVATDLFACTERAARFLYGDAVVDRGRVRIVRNAIPLKRFAFDPAARERVRRELALQNRFALCQAGRFDYQKNQEFLMDLLPELVRRRPETVLVFAGDGPGREQLAERAASAGLAEHVRFPGFYQDIPALFSGCDGFALPSRFEGLGIVLIEAQKNGLPCVASDPVPRDTNITGCAYLPLTDPAAWTETLCALRPAPSRDVPDGAFIAAGYDIDVEAEALQRLYVEMAERP